MFSSETTDFTPIPSSTLPVEDSLNQGEAERMGDNGCLVKLYDVSAEDFRINDVIEFVGVYYSFQGSVDGEEIEDEARDEMACFECDV